MIIYWLKFILISDATFGRGDGIAGFIDAEVQHDLSGLPYLGGRTLRGLLNYECADILFALKERPAQKEIWTNVARRLFGNPGSSSDDAALMRVGDARLPQDLRRAIEAGIHQGLPPDQVLASLTAIRRQTAIDEVGGAPLEGSLRSHRVILRQTPFEAELGFDEEPTPADLALLAACTKALRRAGSGRNRGRGELAARLNNAGGEDITGPCFAYFAQEVLSQ